MKSLLVITLLGEDRPGLVDLLASTVARHGGNWLESRMAHLGGQFAGILRLEVPTDQEPAVTAALQGLKSQGLSTAFHADHPAAPATATSLATLDLVGQDRPGIVRQLSATLARFGVNVEELETSCESAPMTGEALFRAHVRVQLPSPCDLDSLRTELERIAADLMVDLRFQAA